MGGTRLATVGEGFALADPSVGDLADLFSFGGAVLATLTAVGCKTLDEGVAVERGDFAAVTDELSFAGLERDNDTGLSIAALPALFPRAGEDGPPMLVITFCAPPRFTDVLELSLGC